MNKVDILTTSALLGLSWISPNEIHKKKVADKKAKKKKKMTKASRKKNRRK